jgi:hypothetical protein
MRVRAIVTVPPYAPFAAEVARHPIVAGLRLNTVMPIKGEPGPILERLSKLGVPLWVDLKGRQLRVVGAAIPPFTEVRVSHPVRVAVPTDAFFDDGREHARIVATDGDRLILEDGPRRLIGPGESVNIPDPSLEVLGTLTSTDRGYLAAMRDLGLRHIMLSFVERTEDVDEVLEALPGASLALKIESQRGLDFVKSDVARALFERDGRSARLMAARGDLYVEVVRPHRVIGALRAIIAADPDAIVASRLFPSLARGVIPDSTDIGDVAFLLSLGYRTFMLGEEVCLRRDSVMSALNLLEAVATEML